MHSLFHTTILATTLVATLAVGIASAAILVNSNERAAAKADRLPVAASTSYVTVETRGDKLSILARMPVAD